MVKSKFRVGDLIKATEFDGATGLLLSPDRIYRVGAIGDFNSAQGHLLTLDGQYESNGNPLKAYDRRFQLYLETMDTMDDAATEYEEAMEFDRLVNG